MASKHYEDKHGNDPDVKVHHPAKGCEMDGRRDQHTHRQADHREFVDNYVKRNSGGN